MSATVEDLDEILKDPNHHINAKKCLDTSMERAIWIYDELKRTFKDPGELSMVLLLLGASGAMIAVAGDKTQDLKKFALENALTFIAVHVKDFVEYETRELNG